MSNNVHIRVKTFQSRITALNLRFTTNQMDQYTVINLIQYDTENITFVLHHGSISAKWIQFTLILGSPHLV